MTHENQTGNIINRMPPRRAGAHLFNGPFLGLATAALSLGSPTIAQTLAPRLTSGVVFTADEYGATISQIDLKSGTVTTVPATIEPHSDRYGCHR